jgi:glycosyltransferase involved in cell wall biosynthesis
MNIVMLVSSMGTGGAERVASTLVNSWAKRGDIVTLVVTYSGRGTCFYSLASEVRLVYLADLAGSKRRGLSGYASRLIALRKLIRESGADIVISFLYNVNISGILATRGLGVPVIVCEHNNPCADGRPRMWRVLCRVLYPQADIVTLLTEDVVAAFRKLVPGARRVEVVPNPLSEELFALQRPAGRVDHVGPRGRLIAIGRLHMQKRYDMLISTFATLASEFADWDVWIWGEGPERRMLEALIAELGLSERVFLPGKTATPWEEMLRSDALVVTSRFEGLHMGLMEGMALGLPAVAFDCPSGPRELTRDGRDGLLVPSGDAQALASALRTIMSDAPLRAELGRRGALSIRQRYSLRLVLRIWDDLFARVGAGGDMLRRETSDGIERPRS